MNILELVRELGSEYEPKRVSSTRGGEWHGKCPFCKDGENRFVIQPDRCKKNGEPYPGGYFSCPRHCRVSGDAIKFLRELYGLSYKEACERLRIPPKKRLKTPGRLVVPKPTFHRAENPPDLWQQKAEELVNLCAEELFRRPSAVDALLARGFSIDSIKRFRFGFLPKFQKEKHFRPEWGLPQKFKEDGSPKPLWTPTGFVIPTFAAGGKPIKIKIRRSEWYEGDEYGKYIVLTGSKKCQGIYGDTSLPNALVLEGEFDALLCEQEASDLVYCVALGGASQPLDADTYELLSRTEKILFNPDLDKSGSDCWVKWRGLLPKSILALTPEEKSSGNAFVSGLDLRGWIKAHLE